MAKEKIIEFKEVPKYIFIYNPVSGNGKAKDAAKNLEQYCFENGINFEMRETSRPMDATRIAHEYYNDKDAVVFSIGGDGTLNEIAQSMYGAKCKFEVIPAGSGNDFYRILKKSDKKDVKVDLGHVNLDFFINTMSIGADAVICENVEFMKAKRIPPSQIYNASILYTLFGHFKPYHLDVYIDNRPVATKEDNIWLLSICNGSTYGGGINIAPNAEFDDGLLDVYLVKNIKPRRLLPLLLKLKKGQHESCPEIEHFRTNRIHVKSDNEIVCALDGELVYYSDYKVSVEHQAVTIQNNKELVDIALDKSKVYTK